MYDIAKSEALRISHERLLELGWRFSAEDIGVYACKILQGFENQKEKTINTRGVNN